MKKNYTNINIRKYGEGIKVTVQKAYTTLGGAEATSLTSTDFYDITPELLRNIADELEKELK